MGTLLMGSQIPSACRKGLAQVICTTWSYVLTRAGNRVHFKTWTFGLGGNIGTSRIWADLINTENKAQIHLVARTITEDQYLRP